MSTRIITAAVIAALIALNWYIAQRPIDIAPIAPGQTATPNAAANHAAERQIADGNVTAMPATGATDTAFRDRPLFSPTRRPREQQIGVTQPAIPAGDTAEPAPASTDQSGLRLIGVMQIGRDDRRALIRASNAPDGLWLAAGGEVDGWRVATIEPEAVTVAKSGSSEQLVLRRD